MAAMMMRMMQLRLYPCQRMFDFISLYFIVSFCVILRLFVIFYYFVKTLKPYITLFTRVLLRPLGGVISITVGFYYSVLPFVPL
jgi:hypothetical protein